MKNIEKSLDAEFFNRMYEANEDPWDFENSPYEKEKYQATIDVIPGDSYENVFEIGCSNGLLTQMLSPRCKQLLAVDASAIAVRNARKRLENNASVTVEEMTVPENFPDQKFDLILFSEIGYFLSAADLDITKQKLIDALLPGGNLVLVHWTPFVEEFPLTGDFVHEQFINSAGLENEKPLTHLTGKVAPQYRMDVFEKK